MVQSTGTESQCPHVSSQLSSSRGATSAFGFHEHCTHSVQADMRAKTPICIKIKMNKSFHFNSNYVGLFANTF